MTQYSQKLINYLDELISKKLPELQESWIQNGHEGYYQDSVLYESVITEIVTLLLHIYGEEHPIYKKSFNTIHSPYGSFIDSIKGILIGTQQNIKNGFLDDLHDKITADIEIDFLNSSIKLFEQNQIEPAAVLACIVLEDSLKCFAEKVGEAQLRDFKLSQVAQKLLEKNHISKSTHASISSFKELRNSSLHAQWNGIDKNDLKRLFTFLPIFIEKHIG